MLDSTNSTAEQRQADMKDEELITEYRKGEVNRDEFLSNLLGRYVQYLFYLGRIRYLTNEETEELIQETFIDVIRGIADFDITKNFRLWLRFLFYKRLTERKRQSLPPEEVHNESDYHLEELNKFPSTSSNVESLVLDREMYELISEAIEKCLKADERELLFLRYTQDMSIHLIAKRVNQTEKQVRAKLSRAIKKITDYLNNSGALKK